ncbi:MAG: hypothetical protein C0497_03265 [Gemmatimonas sp.]|nr:hypothetical protein [Gemmatimonas sp.]
MVVSLAGLLGLPPLASAQVKWTLGSPSPTVLKIQGRPLLVERLESLGYELWRYGESWVRLSSIDGRVAGWWNADGALKVAWRPGSDTTSEGTFTSGSSRDDVLRLHGTPTAVEPRPASGAVVLRFGPSLVSVSSRDGRVLSWLDPRGALRTRPDPERPNASAPSDLRSRPGGSPLVPDHTGPARVALPSLAVRVALAGARAEGDAVMDAESRAGLDITVWNDGPGVAYGVTAGATIERPTPGIDVGSGGHADSILPGRGVTLRVDLATSDRLPDGAVAIQVRASDRSGRPATNAPRLVVRTRALRPPALVLEGIGVRDQSGNRRIEPREIVDVAARIGNHGVGPARGVRVFIAGGPDVQFTPESARTVVLGDLEAGESRDVPFSAFTGAGATAFPVTLDVREARPRFDTVFTLPLALDQPVASLPALRVRGRDTALRASPAALVVDVDTGIAAAPARPQAVAVVLGVERYGRLPAAAFARHDAAVFREYAQRVFGIGDDPSRLYFRTDDEVTGGELRKLFADDGWLSRRVTAETDLVVYWAGHGQTDLRTKSAYLLPNDADPDYPAQTGLALTELYSRLAALKARSVVVFIDACFSGSTREGAALLAGARGVVVSLEHPALRSATMAVFSAATGEQVANAWPAQQHGVFTYWLLKGLRGDADADTDGVIRVGELDRFVRGRVAQSAAGFDREQTPQVVARDKALAVVRLR